MDLLQASDADIVNRGNFYYAYAISLTSEQTKIIEKRTRSGRRTFVGISEAE